ncbi:MAG: hypothetical protein IKM77_03720 [Prevotella sp.]|nr:hypothetical protein [Prevotella sp.]
MRKPTDLSDNLIISNSRERIHISALVLLYHFFWLSREVLVPISTPKPEL